MSKQIADQFIEALWKLEESRDLEPIVAMYAEDSEVGNVVAPEKFHGPDGAREFWTKYRETFGEIKSTFRNVIATEGHAALEWTTTGTSTGGSPVEYDGVSILEIENGKLTRFRAYFHAAELGRQVTNDTAGAARAK